MDLFGVLITILVGVSLLIWGRELFWLFVAAAGFMTGLEVASRLIPGPVWIGLLLGVLFAIGAALLAVFLKTIAIGLAGFLMGGYILLSLAGLFGLDQGILAWMVYIAGGIGGAILIGMFFDWVVILLSSVGGAALVVNSFDLHGTFLVIVFLLLLVFGIVIQARSMAKDKKK